MVHYCLLAIILLLCLIEPSYQITTPRTGCHAPNVIPHTTQTGSGRTEGSVVTYTCNTGYQATGSPQMTCRGGGWTSGGRDLSCRAIYCPRPTSILRGNYRSMTSSSYTVGVTVTYACYTGYYINGTADITCLSNRTWSPASPRCDKKDCGPPTPVTGANITYTTTNYYSLAYYVCQVGYNLYSNNYLQRSGRVSSRCLSSAIWSANPECRPKDCRLPKNIANGVRFTQGNHLYGQTVTYECNHGFILHGNYTITCQATGAWTLLPECRKVQCDRPSPVAHASSRISSKAYYGNTTYYRCFRGYELVGPAIAACQADGTWTRAPVCNLRDCRTPPSIHFGSYKNTTTTYKSSVEYTCEKGYKLIGTPSIHCQYYGRWTRAPSCEIPIRKGGAASASKSNSALVAAQETSALTALAIACSLFGVITLLCVFILIYKLFIAGRTDKLFSYASYKNGDDTINSNL